MLSMQFSTAIFPINRDNDATLAVIKRCGLTFQSSGRREPRMSDLEFQ